MIKTVVWGENVHEQRDEVVAALYPEGIHGCIAAALNEDPGIEAGVATLQDPRHGLSQERLETTDVLVWWGHVAHEQVADDVVDQVQRRVLEGMGLIVLHSAHFSRIFRRLMGTTCSLLWRDVGEKERVWVCDPGHPIARGLPPSFELPRAEMYGEPFRIARPDELVFLSWFQGGEVFRSGCCWRRGAGRIFYFAPGHETYPIYRQVEVRLVLRNAVHWARQRLVVADACHRPLPSEPL